MEELSDPIDVGDVYEVESRGHFEILNMYIAEDLTTQVRISDIDGQKKTVEPDDLHNAISMDDCELVEHGTE